MKEDEQADEDEEEKAFGPFEDFEACVRRMEQEPGVDDPEGLCADMEENPEEYFQSNANRLLSDLEVTFVSGVGTPAQDSQFILAKSADLEQQPEDPDWQREVDLVVKQSAAAKAEDEGEGVTEQKAWAPALIPEETDKEGDVITKADIENAAHTFLKDYRNVDTEHELLSGKGDPIESWTLKQESTFEKPDGTESRSYPAGTWMLGIEWSDEAWEAIAGGEITGLSIYGEANAIDLQGLETDANFDSVFEQAKALSKAVSQLEKLSEDEHDQLSGAIGLFYEQGGSEADFLRDFLDWLHEDDPAVDPEAVALADEVASELFEAGFEEITMDEFVQFLADQLAADQSDSGEGEGEGEEAEQAVARSSRLTDVTTTAETIAAQATDTALVAKSIDTEVSTITAMSDEESEGESGESGEDQLHDTLKSIQSTVEENNETVKAVSEKQDDLEGRLDSLEDTVGEHEKALDRASFEEDEEDEEEGSEKSESESEEGDGDGDGGDGDEEDPEEVAQETEKAVAKVLGIEQSELPDDPEERSQVLRKNAFETEEDWENASDEGDGSGSTTVSKSAAERAGGSLSLDADDLPDL